MIDMNEVITGVKLSKVCSIRADKDSTESKQVTIKVKFDGATLGSVFEKAVAGAVIQVQNGRLRKEYDQLKNGQVIEIQFSAPAAKAQIDPEQAMITKLQAMTPEQRLAYLKELATKAAKA